MVVFIFMSMFMFMLHEHGHRHEHKHENRHGYGHELENRHERVYTLTQHVRGVFRIKCAGQNIFTTVYARKVA